MVIVVVGGGAAGMLAAWKAKETAKDATVFLLEKNEKLGKKIFITGKGRGNFTNDRDISDFFENYLHNPRFLYSALYGFTNQDLRVLLDRGGCVSKVERGDRVFPVSDHAYSITDCLKRYLKKAGVHIAYKTEVQSIELSDGHVVRVHTNREDYRADRVIVATGGLSYPSTGSTGDGYRFAKEAGHTVTECYPSLVPLEPEEEDWLPLRGLKLKNIRVTVADTDGKSYYSDFGELDFTSAGLGGPLSLSASCHITRYLNCEDRRKRKLLQLHMDLKPSMEDQELDERIRKDLLAAKGKELRNAFWDLLPKQLVPVFVKRLERRGISLQKKVQEVSKEDRREILSLLRDFSYTLRGSGSFREAIITQGGISVKEINPGTMESKKVKGLYFAGEVLDIDAYTGGFNMQAAFSTGYAAGEMAAKSLLEQNV